MTPECVSLLQCPLCQASLSMADKTLRCSEGHSFDIAKQGYVNLLPVQHKKSLSPGDSKDMVRARAAHLDGGYYQPIAERLAQIIDGCLSENPSPVILDAGCGEGYYLNFILGALNSPTAMGMGVDISKEAVLAASKRSKKIDWIVGSNAKLPIENHSVDVILCLFGFPCYEEFVAKLKPGGVLIFVDAGESHLIELRKVIYPEVRQSPSPTHEALLSMRCSLDSRCSLNYSVVLESQHSIQNLLTMTPHMYKAPAAGKVAAAELNRIDVAVDATVTVFSLRA